MESRGSRTPVVTNILKNAIEHKATDIHIVRGLPVMYRIAGELLPLDDLSLSDSTSKKLCYSFLTEEQIVSFEQDLDIDLIKTLGKHRFRVNLSFNDSSVGAVIRILNYSPIPLEDIQLPNIVTEMCTRDKGLILVTGTTSQGKTTSLSAMVDYLNRHEKKHIVTIEDPIEYIHENKQSIVRQREIGRDTHNFAAGLKAALRQDPDVIVIGEMRDYESIQIALTAAETGVLVLSTLHAISIDKILERIFSYVPPGQEDQIRIMLAEALLCVIHQELLPTLSGEKRVACEILVNTQAVKHTIRRRETYFLKSFILTSEKSHGMRTMRHSLELLLQLGEISQDQHDKVIINYPG